MKKVLLIMVLFAISFAGKAQQHYDFSAVNETGLSLYYKITSDANRTVEVVYPHVEGNYWGGYTKPTGSLIIPSSVTHDGVDYTVVSIGEFAFYECTGLTAVTVGSSICEIYSYAFGHCSNLSSIELPDQIYKIGDRAFSGTALTEITLPLSLSLIEEACFSDCNSLVSITIPANVTEIGRMAFLNCSSLQSVTFNDSLQKIWDSAFGHCSSLTEVEIPNSVIQIRWSAFSNCSNLSTVTIGTGTTEIQQYAFRGCIALETVNFNAINCTVSDEASFCDSPRFKNLNIGEEVQLIDDFAFTNCNSITKLVIPNSVTTIKSRAFKECKSLDTIEIGNSLQTLADDAFAYCGDSLLYISVNQDNPYFDTRNDCNAIIRTSTDELVLGSVNTIIPDGIISIGNYAFANHRMTSINIPNTIQTIGNESFNYCYLLDTIISEAMTPPLAYPTTFNGCGIHYDDFESTNVYVPYGTSHLYRNATGWNYFSNFIERGMIIGGAEWYYEIQNDNGSITYQQLQQEGDTVINHKDVKIIVRTNTLYDKHQEITHEYVYEENDVVYWWDKENENFTVLYDQNAEVGDEWQITKGGRSIIVRVDEVSEYEYDGRTFKMMHVSDENDVFTGNIVCGIGHLTSWFPEKIMRVYRDSQVESLRCYWVNGDLIFHQGDTDCDAILTVEENVLASDFESISLYPNPTNGTLYIENQGNASTFSISNMLGQTIMTGNVADSQTIDVSLLDDGMYFICIGQRTVKFVVRK